MQKSFSLRLTALSMAMVLSGCAQTQMTDASLAAGAPTLQAVARFEHQVRRHGVARRSSELNAREHWVCVQSVVADRQGNVWVLDAAAPAQGAVVPMGPKLVKIDLATNRA